MPKRMLLPYDDPKHWRARAMETRIAATRLLTPEGRYRMLAIARRYEEIAERAQQTLPIVLDRRDMG